MTTTETERTVEEQARMVARRFHDQHEQRYASRRGEDPRPWDEMPESYTRRVIDTFDALIRKGIVAPGPQIGWERDDEPARF